MASERDAVAHGNPWPWIGWVGTLVIVFAAGMLGFVVLGRYQQNGPVLGIWAAMCRSIGLTFDGLPAAEAKAPLVVSSRVVWSAETLERVKGGDPQRGVAIAVTCEACHGARGVSTAGLMPTLAGMNATVIYKQLDDFRNSLRSWKDMTLVASLLSPQDTADVASYWASRPGLPHYEAERIPADGRSLHQSDPTTRLVYAGDPERGIAACSACHGPGGHKLGAPVLQGQQAAYLEHQLVAFATGLRGNDINEQMRTIARQLTAGERRELAAFYGTAGSPAQAMHLQHIQ